MLGALPYLLFALPGMAASSNATWGPTYWVGAPSDFGTGINPEGELLASSLAQPNATRSVPFVPFKNFTEIPSLGTWNFRINVSSFHVPDARSVGNSVPDPLGQESHIISASYDLSWAGGGIIPAANARTICVTIPVIENWPANVTNAYAETQSSSASCEPVLGKACTDAIVDRQIRGGGVISNNACRSPDRLWGSIPECAGSFGYGRKTARWTGSTTAGITPEGIKVPANESARVDVNGSIFYQPWTSGRGFYTQISEPVKGGLSQRYLEYSNRLHVVMLAAQIPGDGVTAASNIGMEAIELLCMRVNYTKLAENVRTDGKITTVGDAVLAPSGAGRAVTGGVIWLAMGLSFGTVLLTGGLRL